MVETKGSRLVNMAYILLSKHVLKQKILLMMHQGIDPVAQKRQLKNDFKSEKEANELIPTLEQAYQVYKSKKS